MMFAAGIKVFTLAMVPHHPLGAMAARTPIHLPVDFYRMTFPSNEIARSAPRASQRMVWRTQGIFLH
jgi:hypothetical protein